MPAPPVARERDRSPRQKRVNTRGDVLRGDADAGVGDLEHGVAAGGAHGDGHPCRPRRCSEARWRAGWRPPGRAGRDRPPPRPARGRSPARCPCRRTRSRRPGPGPPRRRPGPPAPASAACLGVSASARVDRSSSRRPRRSASSCMAARLAASSVSTPSCAASMRPSRPMSGVRSSCARSATFALRTSSSCCSVEASALRACATERTSSSPVSRTRVSSSPAPMASAPARISRSGRDRVKARYRAIASADGRRHQTRDEVHAVEPVPEDDLLLGEQLAVHLAHGDRPQRLAPGANGRGDARALLDRGSGRELKTTVPLWSTRRTARSSIMARCRSVSLAVGVHPPLSA